MARTVLNPLMKRRDIRDLTGVKMRLLKTMLATTLLAGSLSANAIPVTFDLAGAPTSSVDVDFQPGRVCVGCGISATLNPLLGSLNRTLDVNESWEFDFFDLGFYGLIGGGEGTIQASLGFDSPLGAPNADGSGEGGFFTLFGAITGGNLTWQQPSAFSLADGTLYSVAFENLHGITLDSTTVSGTITLLQDSGSVSVPEPGTMGLLGLALLGMGFGARRKVKAA